MCVCLKGYIYWVDYRGRKSNSEEKWALETGTEGKEGPWLLGSKEANGSKPGAGRGKGKEW